MNGNRRQPDEGHGDTMQMTDGMETGGHIPHEPNAAKPRILLVDDTAIIRFVYTEILTKSGFGVVQAPDAEAARARVMEGVAIDLLLTDYQMPGMNGVMLAKWFQSHRPNTPVVLLSSDSENVRLAKEELAWLHGHHKPSTKKDLLRIVQSALGSAAAPPPRKFPEPGARKYFNFQHLENPDPVAGFLYRVTTPALPPPARYPRPY